MPALLADLAEVHAVDVASLLPLLYRRAGDEVNLCPAVDPDGVGTAGMIEVPADDRIDGAAQVFQTDLVQLLSPVQTKERMAVHVLHHEDMSEDPSKPFLLNAKRCIILPEVRAAVSSEPVAANEEGGHHCHVDEARPVPRLEVGHHAPHPGVLKINLAHQLPLLIPVLPEEVEWLLPKPFQWEKQVESDLRVTLTVSVKIQLTLRLVKDSFASATWRAECDRCAGEAREGGGKTAHAVEAELGDKVLVVGIQQRHCWFSCREERACRYLSVGNCVPSSSLR